MLVPSGLKPLHRGKGKSSFLSFPIIVVFKSLSSHPFKLIHSYWRSFLFSFIPYLCRENGFIFKAKSLEKEVDFSLPLQNGR